MAKLGFIYPLPSKYSPES